MTIMEAIKGNVAGSDLRLTYGNRWLVFSSGTFEVYERKRGFRKSRTVVVTVSEEHAVQALLYG